MSNTLSIEEGNKLIALWMGAIDETGYFQASTIGKTKVPMGRMYMTDRFPNNMHLCSWDDLKYHTSFDWIMTAVEKIQSLNITPPPNYSGYRIEIVIQGYVKISGLLGPSIFTNVSIEGSLIKAVRQAVIQFIQWYSSTKSKP